MLLGLKQSAVGWHWDLGISFWLGRFWGQVPSLPSSLVLELPKLVPLKKAVRLWHSLATPPSASQHQLWLVLVNGASF